MGQYFLIANLDRKEYIDPHSLGYGAKLWEICASNLPGLLVYLLRKSNELGGGDVRDEPSELGFCGRWAGNKIVVIGDYDESGLFRKIRNDPSWKDISADAADEYNDFIGSSHLMVGNEGGLLCSDVALGSN